MEYLPVKMSDTPPRQAVPVSYVSRVKSIDEAFGTKYGNESSFYARCSGRVNLIGEHIDYCGYAVLPMAIDQDIIVACRPLPNKELRLANTQPEYKDFVTKLDNFTIEKGNPEWYKYFLCGVRGVADHLKVEPSDLTGMEVMVDGVIPASAGLSSSSAMVCVAALATMQANGGNLPTKTEFASICQHCEYHIGTAGGGMDQSIIFLAEAGTAKLIEFDPIRASDVQLPDGGSFVIANSCAEHNKAASGEFNTRVAEDRLACQIIAKSKGLKWREFLKLGALQEALSLSFSDMVELVQSTLHKGLYTKDEVCEILGVTAEELEVTSIPMLKQWNVSNFNLHDRAFHVYSEARRVVQFKSVCDQQPADALQQLGQLMNESHASCRDLYQCSCPELDRLCQLALDHGALGSRLTGAGWGGCCVSLVPTAQVPKFIEAIKGSYYNTDKLRGKVQSSLFSTQPGAGAVIFVK